MASREPEPWHASLGDEAFVDQVYRDLLDRAADSEGIAHWTAQLRDGLPRERVEHALALSPEAAGRRAAKRAEAEAKRAEAEARRALESFHQGRVAWIRSLPPARRILDLGGTALDSDHGALQVMGYPYDFDELTIIELPVASRHELYRVPEMEAIDSPHGPVRYLYRSMTELSDLPDESFDLICSGQTFEHITEDEGRLLLHDVRRLLTPYGALALDTPNRAITAIECREGGVEFINPDHKVEYTHAQMLGLFAGAGLVVLRQHGIGYMPQTAATATFVRDELIEHPTLYADVERCYTLAYLVGPA